MRVRSSLESALLEGVARAEWRTTGARAMFECGPQAGVAGAANDAGVPGEGEVAVEEAGLADVPDAEEQADDVVVVAGLGVMRLTMKGFRGA